LDHLSMKSNTAIPGSACAETEPIQQLAFQRRK
jgi:hypothetical protein